MQVEKLTREQLAAVFNEWMRQYLLDRPAGDKLAEERLIEYQKNVADNVTPVYGAQCIGEIEAMAGEMFQN